MGKVVAQKPRSPKRAAHAILIVASIRPPIPVLGLFREALWGVSYGHAGEQGGGW
jgi:hypothetical protein